MELLAKSSFSFLRGASSPETLIHQAASQGHQTLGIVDHMGFYGSARAHTEAQKLGLKAIVGTTIDQISQCPPLTILTKSRTGYQNLSRFLTLVHCNTKTTSLADFSPTGTHAVLTPESLNKQTKGQLLTTAIELRNHFGAHNLSIALFRHFRRGEERRNTLLRDLANHLKIPLLASNAPIYSKRSDRLLADAFTSLREHCTLDEAGQKLECNGERFLKSPQDLHNLFTDYPQAIKHAYQLSEECSHFSLQDLGYRFPSYQDPQTGKLFTEQEQDHYLHYLAHQGLKKRLLKISEKHLKQIDNELVTINKLKFSGYFLIVWDLVRFARTQGILCQGRGSAANSLVCHALGITSIDPVESGLLFERFLSMNRKSWPDIDIDFPSGKRREAVIQYLYQKYAPYGAAMTANVITYRPRSAFREMAKALGFCETISKRFSDLSNSLRDREISSKMMTPPTQRAFQAEVGELSEIIIKSGVPASHPRFHSLVQLYIAALNTPRHLGQHSGGIVFCDHGLDHIVPLQPATMADRMVLQWDKDDCEDLGIVKVDLLGLGMLAAMEDTIKICERRGHPVNLARISKKDPKTFDLLCRADTIGTFQVESRAQMATLPIMQPKNFYDVAIEVAIIRPGPIVGDLVHPYLNRRTGRESIDYIHPDFKPILERTLGVPLFQEQVLRMAMLIADFSGSEADQLRKAMTFKHPNERMNPIISTLRERMSKRKVSSFVQDRVIQAIGSFALYGFPESHAISFALIAYASCWLKAHRPAEFYCGLINNQPMGFYSVNTLLQDAKRHHIRCKPVSVIHSMIETEVIDDHRLRLGLHQLKGLSYQTMESLIEARSQKQFQTFDDFSSRLPMNKKELRILAASGALNDFPEIAHRRDALWKVEHSLSKDLFTHTQPTSKTTLPMMTPLERLQTDYHFQGATIGAHPMKLWRQEHSEHLATSFSLGQLSHGAHVIIAGLVICRQRPSTAKGHCFISLEDEFGIANLFIPQKTFQQYRLTITTEEFLLVEGRLQITEGKQPTVYVIQVQPFFRSSKLSTSSHDFH